MKKLLLAPAILAMSTMAWADRTSESPIFELDPVFATLGDQRPETDFTILSRREKLVSYTVKTSGLLEESPHTVWLVVYNYPEYCQTTPCGLFDLPFLPGHDPRVQASFVNAGGGVSNVDGTGHFTGTVYAASRGVNGSEVVVGPGMINTRSSQIDIVLRFHGQPANLSDLLAAIKEYRGACNDSNLVQPPCGDYQISAHLP
ncbi:MAG: hypothetical protein AAGA95_13480 [Pseudomonadota bacterium]